MKIYYLAYGIFSPPGPEEEKSIRAMLEHKLTESINDPNLWNRPQGSQGGEIFAGLVPGSDKYIKEFKRCFDNMYFSYELELRNKVECANKLLYVMENEDRKKIESMPNFIKWMPDSFNKANDIRL